MTAIQLKSARETTLQMRENEALAHLDSIQQHWQSFVVIALDIQKSNDWQLKADSWDAYCKQTFNVAASTIRVYKSSSVIAELIANVTDATPNEITCRNLNSVVGSDKHLAPIIYTMALEHTDNPQKRHFKAAYDVYTEAKKTGHVTVAGEQAPIGEPLSQATKEAMQESDMRRNQHIYDAKKVTGTIARDSSGLLIFTPDTPDKARIGRVSVVFD